MVHILTCILSYVNSKASLVLAALYNVEEPQLNKSHASKAKPQYGFHRGIRGFGDQGRDATKQELYEILLGMDAVTMIKPKNYN